jgi:hypothetical protein
MNKNLFNLIKLYNRYSKITKPLLLHKDLEQILIEYKKILIILKYYVLKKKWQKDYNKIRWQVVL